MLGLRQEKKLAEMMQRKKVDILCVQEARWKGIKARSRVEAENRSRSHLEEEVCLKCSRGEKSVRQRER